GWCFGRANPVAVFSETLERSYGVRLQDTWVARFLGRAVEPLLLAAAILLWLSTCFTVVPVQSEGVRVTLGKFAEAPVGPGLHLTPPWPFGSIEQVDTRRVRSLEIGYGEDLGGPVLWTERHYAGEKNMLVGEGDELLTVNVPVFYRISDPIAFLRHTENAETAVGQIAFRQLVRAMASADSFAIMLSRRDAIAGRIRTGIQEEIDRLGLGLEIMFVGLKDIHPPVDVAVAYQDVISAREDKLTYVIDGETYRARRLPETEADAHRSRMEAGADAAKRVLTAAGDTARFEMVEAAQRDQPGLFRTRLQLDHAEATLSAVPKVVIDHRAKATPGGGYLLDLRRLQRQATPGGDTPATPLFDPTVTEPSPYVDENRPPPGQGGFEPAPSSEDMNLPE
ncbi:MAG: protease modulator HflK, partial [Verrucomicrobiota bacterium]